MGQGRVFMLTALAMLAFAANSLLCRLALKPGLLDPASCISLRLASGALMLGLLLRTRGVVGRGGDWTSALALFIYAAAFTFAYVSLPVGTGALLLFGAVQVTMLIAGYSRGERQGPAQVLGLAGALAGLVYLVLPGLTAPDPMGAVLMAAAGIAWGVYSLRGRRGSSDALAATAGNFLLAVPLALLFSLWFLPRLHVTPLGAFYAITSGAVTSGLGYVVWYAALKGLTATRAAIVQLSVPVIAAFGGVLVLYEAVTPRLLISSCAVLGGVALAIWGRQRRA